jgi:branched-chain amino acid transport system substrate-binding protein
MKRRHLFAGAIVVLSMIAAGANAQTAGVTKDTIKIGVFGPLTGSASIFGKAVFGAEALYKDVNDQGGIHGRKIEIVREDDGCDPARGISTVKKLISQDKVFMLHGGVCSGVVMAIKPDVIKSGIPFVVLGAASNLISEPTVANLFHPIATTVTVAYAMVDFVMTRKGVDKIAFVSHSDDWGKSNRDPAVEHLKAAYKLGPVVDLSMERGSSDATPQILKLKESGAQVVLAMLYPAELAIFMRDAYKYGLKTPVLGNQGVSLEDTRNRAGSPAAVDDLFVFFPLAAPYNDPPMAKWANLVTKYFPSEKLDTFSFLGMGGTLAIIEALKRAGPDLTQDKFIAALNTIRNFETGVLSAPISFTPEDHAGVKGGQMLTYVKGKPTIMPKWVDK